MAFEQAFEQAFEWEEAALADNLLIQAFADVAATGDHTKLGLRDTSADESDQSTAIVTFLAITKRIEFARVAVLWTALGVEAAANFYISTMLPQEADALDDLKAVNKLLVAPRLATGKSLFAPDAEPVGQLRRLFTLRNRIVHPRGGKHSIVGKKGVADFTPHAAGNCLIVAGTTLRTLLGRCQRARSCAPSGWTRSWKMHPTYGQCRVSGPKGYQNRRRTCWTFLRSHATRRDRTRFRLPAAVPRP